MHELSIAENMLKIALDQAHQHGAQRITGLNILVGDLASIESLEFHWSMVSQGTLAEGAKIHFEPVVTMLYCQDCGQCYEFHPSHDQVHSHDYTCPRCGGQQVEIMSGGETFRLESIEVET